MIQISESVTDLWMKEEILLSAICTLDLCIESAS